MFQNTLIKQSMALALVTAITLFVSCSKEVIRGGGSVGTKTINLSAFNRVESHYDIKAVISYGATQQVTVTGYNNLLDILDFKVEDGVLKLKYNTNYNTIRNGNVVATITVPALAAVTIHGSEHIDVRGFANGNSLDAKIHGSGNINIGTSNYQSALLDVYGSGKIDAQGLQVRNAVVNIHGSGHSYITVSDKLVSRIFGSGNIYYWGNPTVEVSLNGSGRVIKR